MMLLSKYIRAKENVGGISGDSSYNYNITQSVIQASGNLWGNYWDGKSDLNDNITANGTITANIGIFDKLYVGGKSIFQLIEGGGSGEGGSSGGNCYCDMTDFVTKSVFNALKERVDRLLFGGEGGSGSGSCEGGCYCDLTDFITTSIFNSLKHRVDDIQSTLNGVSSMVDVLDYGLNNLSGRVQWLEDNHGKIQTLEVSGNSTLSGTLNVYGQTHIHNNLTIDDYLSCVGNAFFNSGVIIGGILNVDGNIVGTKDASIYGSLNVGKNVTIGENILVSGDSTIEGDSSIGGDEEIKGNIEVGGNAHISGDLKVDGEAEMKHINTDLLCVGDKEVVPHIIGYETFEPENFVLEGDEQERNSGFSMSFNVTSDITKIKAHFEYSIRQHISGSYTDYKDIHPLISIRVGDYIAYGKVLECSNSGNVVSNEVEIDIDLSSNQTAYVMIDFDTEGTSAYLIKPYLHYTLYKGYRCYNQLASKLVKELPYSEALKKFNSTSVGLVLNTSTYGDYYNYTSFSLGGSNVYIVGYDIHLKAYTNLVSDYSLGKWSYYKIQVSIRDTMLIDKNITDNDVDSEGYINLKADNDIATYIGSNGSVLIKVFYTVPGEVNNRLYSSIGYLDGYIKLQYNQGNTDYVKQTFELSDTMFDYSPQDKTNRNLNRKVNLLVDNDLIVARYKNNYLKLDEEGINYSTDSGQTWNSIGGGSGSDSGSSHLPIYTFQKENIKCYYKNKFIHFSLYFSFYVNGELVDFNDFDTNYKVEGNIYVDNNYSTAAIWTPNILLYDRDTYIWANGDFNTGTYNFSEIVLMRYTIKIIKKDDNLVVYKDAFLIIPAGIYV